MDLATLTAADLPGALEARYLGLLDGVHAYAVLGEEWSHAPSPALGPGPYRYWAWRVKTPKVQRDGTVHARPWQAGGKYTVQIAQRPAGEETREQAYRAVFEGEGFAEVARAERGRALAALRRDLAE